MAENQTIDGDKTLIEKATEAAKELRAANAEKRVLLEREEKLRADDLLGGSSDAGQAKPEINEAEQKKQSAMEFWKGTDIEKAIQKHG